MSVKDLLNKKIAITQIKSSSKLGKRQVGCLIGLGLRGIGSTSNLKCDESVAGMVKKVEHIIKVDLV